VGYESKHDDEIQGGGAAVGNMISRERDSGCMNCMITEVRCALKVVKRLENGRLTSISVTCLGLRERKGIIVVVLVGIQLYCGAVSGDCDSDLHVDECNVMNARRLHYQLRYPQLESTRRLCTCEKLVNGVRATLPLQRFLTDGKSRSIIKMHCQGPTGLLLENINGDIDDENREFQRDIVITYRMYGLHMYDVTPLLPCIIRTIRAAITTLAYGMKKRD
jgi:hypothetical protein